MYTLAGALPMASALILLPFYIQYLPTESYGTLALCLAFASLIQVITAYSFDSALYIYFHELKNEKEKLALVVSSSFTIMLALGMGVVASSVVVGHYVFELFAKKTSIEFYPNGLLAVVLGICQALFRVHGNLLQTRERPVPFLISNLFAFSVIAATSISGLILFPNSLVGPLGGRVLAFGLVALWALARIYSEFGFHFQNPWKVISFKFNAYTFVYQLQQWVVNYFDRFIILWFMPVAAMASVGIYDFAVKCLVPIELILNGLNATIFPRVIPLITAEKDAPKATPEINRYFYGQVSVIMLVISFLVLVFPYAFELFKLSNGYGEALRLIPFLAPLFILRSIRLYFVVPLNALKYSRQLTTISLVVSICKVGCMYWALSRWGVGGIIVASGIAYLIEIILLWRELTKHYKIQANLFKLIIGPVSLMLLAFVFEFFRFIPDRNLAHLLLWFICIGILAFVYQNEMHLLKKVIARK